MYHSNRGNFRNRNGQNRLSARPPQRRGGPKSTLRLDHLVATIGNRAPETQYVNKYSFEGMGLNPQLLRTIQHLGYTTPTPIQDQTIPHILEGKDLIGLANTGTGKTAAFLIPVLHQLAQNPNQKVLVIAPTRELALQIDQELRKLRQGLRIWSVLAIGGTNMFRQVQDIRRNYEVLIGTPGRLKDLLQQNLLDLSQTTTLVLDEVDRMLDMGFLPDVKLLLSQLPANHQSLFFSATITPHIHGLTQQFLKSPITVSVKATEMSHLVEHELVKVNSLDHKHQLLTEILEKDDSKKVLIFGRTKRSVHKLMFTLKDQGFRAESIHGDKPLSQRKRALADFRNSFVDILVATDVAARGIDVPDITHVINFDMPQSLEDYIHRAGRTGRAQNKGIAITFVDRN